MRKHRKILISRVLILIVAILSVLCILGAVILFFTMMFNGSDSTDPTTPSPSAEVMESTSIEGTIVDATMNTLSIVTDDGRVLAFNSENMDSTTSGNGLFIDTRVRIDYQGNLDDSSVRQFVMVQDITALSGSTIVTPSNPKPRKPSHQRITRKKRRHLNPLLTLPHNQPHLWIRSKPELNKSWIP